MMREDARRGCTFRDVSRRAQRIRADVPLVGDVDAEERFERFPPGYTTKGMFFSRLLALGGEDTYAQMESRLAKRPQLGRYLPFSDYPQVDFSRLAHHVALARFPDQDVVEAMRRLAREDLRAFAASALGSVMFALVGSDPKVALLKLPDMYAASLKGGSVRAKELGPGVIELSYTDFYGWLDCYPIGHIEGLAMHCDRSCEIEVEARTEIDAVFRVHLS